ncbi:MAG: NADP-dependent oxidoreductase [Capsulimonadaceae bacterium]
MKAIVVTEFGGADVLRAVEIPDPQAGDGELLVDVHAASINPVDYKRASGAYQQNMPITLPWIPGADFAGVVAEVGSGVTGFAPGDRVFGTATGAYAERVVTRPNLIAKTPKSLSDIDAAAVPVAGQTAWQMLFDRGELTSCQRVLIHAAAGGVGTFAVQLAQWAGAEVTATGSASNAEFLRSIGADIVVDYKATPFETVVEDMDLVIDLVGGDTQIRSLGVVKPGGALISAVRPPQAEISGRTDIRAEYMSMRAGTRNLDQLANLIDSGVLRVIVTSQYPLLDAAAAWRSAMEGHTRGKAVLVVRP